MRRWLGLLVVSLLAFPGLAAGAASGEVDYYDSFATANYTGNHGDLDFDGPWREINDDGSHGSGLVSVASDDCPGNHCLQLSGPGVMTSSFGAFRHADLADFATARLEYRIQVSPALGDTAELRVAVWNGSKWVTVNTHPLGASASQQKSIDVTTHANAGFGVRFLVSGVDGGLLDLTYSGDTVIDDVRITGSLRSTTTTSTTTTSTTTSTSTSTTSSPSTTTTSSTSTTTSTTSTTTTTVRSTSSTTVAPTTSDTRSSGASGDDFDSQTTTTEADLATSTTDASSTSTTTAATTDGPPSSTSGSGLRQPLVGLMADYQRGTMGDTGIDEVEVLGAEVDADFSMAVEALEAARTWIAILALLISGALVSGMDWRRSRVARQERVSRTMSAHEEI